MIAEQIHSFSGGRKKVLLYDEITHTSHKNQHMYYRKKLCLHFHVLSLEKETETEAIVNNPLIVLITDP